MPYRVIRLANGKVQVRSPHGITARATSREKAQRQVRLLRAVKHGFIPKRRQARPA